MKHNKLYLVIIAILCAFVSLFSACSPDNTKNGHSGNSSNNDSGNVNPPSSGTRIQMTFDNQTIYGTLDNNSVSRDLISRLPLTLEFSDYNGTEKIAYLPENSDPWDMSDAPDSCTPQAGDITMYSPWGNLAVFYQPFRLSDGLIPLGKLDDGEIEKIAAKSGSFSVTISILKETDKPTENEALVVYFSYSGTTERIAQIIAEKSGATLIEIQPKIPYTSADVNYNDSSSRSQVERRNDARPEISEQTYSDIDLSKYSTVFIGHPIWNGYEPMIIRTFIDHYNGLTGKTVYTFSTSASSSGNTAFNSIKSRCPSANVKENLHFTSSAISHADSTIETKLSEWNLLKENFKRF